MAKHKVDELFSDGLENFEPTPSPTAWEQIESQLDQNRGRSYWAWVGIAASAMLLLASSWLIFNQAEETDTYRYDYADTDLNNLSLPAEVVYVPIYIYTVVEKPAKLIIPKTVTPMPEPGNVVTREESVMLAESQDIPVERAEIITLEDVPLITAEEVLTASAATPVTEKPATLQPVTIIYKQGEPAEESNFVKAMNYMEEVRMGEKKLVNFDKLRENFRSRFRSEEGTD